MDKLYAMMYKTLFASFLLLSTAAASTDDSIKARTLNWYDQSNVDSIGYYRLALTIHDDNPGLADVHIHHVIVDTGSVGFLISACQAGYKEASQLENYESAFEFLDSSGAYSLGYWVPKELIFTSSNGNKLHSTTRVLVVNETGTCDSASTCADSKRNVAIKTCYGKAPTPEHEPLYFGIGFARSSLGQPNATAIHNVLLNVDYSAFDGIHQGYKIGKEGLVLGVADTDLDGYKTLQLTKNTSVTWDAEWNPVPMCVRVANSGVCENGTALFDTGLNYSYLAINESVRQRHKEECPPEYEYGGACLKTNTTVDVFIGNWGNPVTSYSYQANDLTEKPQVSPAWNVLEGREVNNLSYVNSGRFFFNGYDMIFDAENGVVGFNWTGTDNLVPNQWHAMGQQPLLKTDL